METISEERDDIRGIDNFFQDAFYVLKYDKEAVSVAISLGEAVEEEGIEGAFEVTT